MSGRPVLRPSKGIKISAAGSSLLLLATPHAALPGAADQAEIQVRCASGESFGIRLARRHAIVKLGERQLRLARARSSLGQRFSSKDSALVIDGDFVALVLADSRSFEDCHMVERATRER